MYGVYYFAESVWTTLATLYVLMVLLKKAGNYVRAGEAIAIIGNTGELTDGPHLHFDLWHRGKPMNPMDFLNFN